MGFNQAFTPAPDHKIMINIGAGLDIPTGRWLIGRFGESLLNGGLASLTGIIGPGNMFKSTLMHCMVLTALSRIYGGEGGTYETEISMHNDRMQDFADQIPEFQGEDIIESKRWVITDSTVYSGNKWFEVEKEELKKKRADKSMRMRTPYMNYDRTDSFFMLRPTFREVDSLSAWMSDKYISIQEENEIGDKGANMLYMRGGNDKTRLIEELPGLCGGACHYMLLSAHLGKAFNLDPNAPVRKQLQHIPADYKIKGAPEKFTFHMHNAWLCFKTEILKNDSTKAPEYPRSPDDDLKGDTDLNLVWVVQTRGKNGPSGMPIGIIVSQEEGWLPALSEFHYCKTSERYGLEGNVQNYAMALMPDVKLSRTTVRRKIDADHKLRNAIHFTSEMCQMNDLWHGLKRQHLCTPKELYDDLKAMGYDWDVLLDTRPWVGLDADAEYEKNYLSTMCLLRMRAGLYHPYWMTPKVDGKVVSNATLPRSEWKEVKIDQKSLVPQ